LSGAPLRLRQGVAANQNPQGGFEKMRWPGSRGGRWRSVASGEVIRPVRRVASLRTQAHQAFAQGPRVAVDDDRRPGPAGSAD
ncbi:hypothetical protein Q2463_27215, partial [Escherichia coli]|nr:hypothetical protein [Escherichia coli]